ncbi:TetR/AcrR family transcriptional regulator [Clavibacter phaseoli]|uniref:TetR/AcrR family transcriptional regulator n=1 Tax=Clavibacter phaseoli TaxID=1734031 RepID=UPI001F201AB3|nr:TetR/AcrR family transcriptional regulator [Clavibacter phaseoli]UKF32475.1 TetR family transcriptional regulator [Clavibacter phaseoli]UKF38504.1 TetR family transcriptional regulator [Clavibacter phaseoli]
MAAETGAVDRGARIPLRTRRRDATLQEIADAALELFESQGYADTTVEQIADAAGISLRTFYRHCSAKDEVLTSHLASGPSELVSAVKGHADLPLVDAVVAAFVAATTNSSRRRELRIVIETPALRAAWLAAGREAQDDLVDVIRDRSPEQSPLHARARAAAITGVLTMVLETWVSEDAGDLESLTRDALRVVGLG